MARPTQPKGNNKPEGHEALKSPSIPAVPSQNQNGKFIILILIIIFSTVMASMGSMYFIGTQIFLPSIKEQLAGKDPEQTGDEANEKPENTINLNLNDFTVNLKSEPDRIGNQYLRTKISLVVTVHEEQNCYVTADEKKGEGESEGGKDIVVCMEAFQNHMGKFTPAMRDIINSALMSRTATQLSTIEGQEALKDEIKENINGIIDAHHKIIRVNFEDFIVQR